MNQKHGRCPLCGGIKTEGKTTFTVDLKFGVVVVREVPALVCDQCGEAWIEDGVAERLEQMVRRCARQESRGGGGELGKNGGGLI